MSNFTSIVYRIIYLICLVGKEAEKYVVGSTYNIKVDYNRYSKKYTILRQVVCLYYKELYISQRNVIIKLCNCTVSTEWLITSQSCGRSSNYRTKQRFSSRLFLVEHKETKDYLNHIENRLTVIYTVLLFHHVLVLNTTIIISKTF